MPRYRMTIEYDGGPFVGWQAQANGLSVQTVLENAIAAFTGETVTVHGAGRTDAGVHGLGQVAHFDLARAWDTEVLRRAANAHMRHHPVVVLAAATAAPDFHSRFSATGRHYLYRILNRRSPAAIDRGRVWWLPGELDAAAMAEAAKRLLGTHDFTTFRSGSCQAKSPVKTLDRLDVVRLGDMIEVRASARSFLHHQVRSMVGTIRMVGEGKWTADDVAAALAACDRTACGPVAPAHGLYLVGVDYSVTK